MNGIKNTIKKINNNISNHINNNINNINTDIKNNIKQLNEPLRIFLSGELRIAMLQILDSVLANPFLQLHAALYELSDAELIEKLCKIGARAHIVLSDGSNSKNIDGKTNRHARSNWRNIIADDKERKNGLGNRTEQRRLFKIPGKACRPKRF
jgi:hypothetical protein